LPNQELGNHCPRRVMLYLPSKEELQRKLPQWAREAGGE
jgi:hypothetical protein